MKKNLNCQIQKKNVDYNEKEDEFKKQNKNVIYENQNFNENQKNIIREYTSEDGYGSNEVINKYLNNEKELGDNVKKIVDKKINILDSCITQPLNENIYVYRGIKIKPESLKVNGMIENKGFISTSIYKYDAGNFGIGTGTIIKIKVNKGTKALYIGDKTSFKKNEHELLFGRNHSIKIIKIEKLFDKDGDFMNYDIEGELV